MKKQTKQGCLAEVFSWGQTHECTGKCNIFQDLIYQRGVSSMTVRNRLKGVKGRRGVGGVTALNFAGRKLPVLFIFGGRYINP
jgi:hypothetical protein